MHSPLFVLLIVLVVVAAILGAFAKKLKSGDSLFANPWPLEAKRQLLTERERALYQRLSMSDRLMGSFASVVLT
ncbi:MAG TPA: hypothetical protein VGD63_10325 [Steroidobacteraceae bacterium]